MQANPVIREVYFSKCLNSQLAVGNVRNGSDTTDMHNKSRGAEKIKQ